MKTYELGVDAFFSTPANYSILFAQGTTFIYTPLENNSYDIKKPIRQEG